MLYVCVRLFIRLCRQARVLDVRPGGGGGRVRSWAANVYVKKYFFADEHNAVLLGPYTNTSRAIFVLQF